MDEILPTPVEGGWLEMSLASSAPPPLLDGTVEGGWLEMSLAPSAPPPLLDGVIEGGWLEILAPAVDGATGFMVLGS